MYLHKLTLKSQLLEFMRLPLYCVYKVNRKSVIIYSSVATINVALFWDKFIQKYKEFSSVKEICLTLECIFFLK